jgi:hypothetical protein
MHKAEHCRFCPDTMIVVHATIDKTEKQAMGRIRKHGASTNVFDSSAGVEINKDDINNNIGVIRMTQRK